MFCFNFVSHMLLALMLFSSYHIPHNWERDMASGDSTPLHRGQKKWVFINLKRRTVRTQHNAIHSVKRERNKINIKLKSWRMNTNEKDNREKSGISDVEKANRCERALGALEFRFFEATKNWTIKRKIGDEEENVCERMVDRGERGEYAYHIAYLPIHCVVERASQSVGSEMCGTIRSCHYRAMAMVLYRWQFSIALSRFLIPITRYPFNRKKSRISEYRTMYVTENAHSTEIGH